VGINLNLKEQGAAAMDSTVQSAIRQDDKNKPPEALKKIIEDVVKRFQIRR
jgi:hypothetical protein